MGASYRVCPRPPPLRKGTKGTRRKGGKGGAARSGLGYFLGGFSEEILENVDVRKLNEFQEAGNFR